MKEIPCKQGTWEWWLAKRGVPSASNGSAIITKKEGAYPNESSLTYICKLIADRLNPQYGFVDEPKSKAMIRGNELEPEARRMYALENAASKVEEVGFVTTDDGRFGCSPDSMLADRSKGQQFKCPDPHTHIRYLWEGILPWDYRPQVHMELAVTGCESWDFYSYCVGFESFQINVKPDGFTEQLKANLEIFWLDYQKALEEIRKRVPEPPPRPIIDCGIFGTVEIPSYISPY